ncbi:MAG: diguanylate cyclase [Myxococcota bacterium]
MPVPGVFARLVAALFAAAALARTFPGVAHVGAQGVLQEATITVSLSAAAVWWMVLRPIREAARRAEAERQQFEARLSRALLIAEDEESVVGVLARGAEEVAGAATLVADAPGGAVRQPGGCGVASLAGCVAARRAKTMRFDDARALDACPRLADGDACSAACVPVLVQGRATAVLHARASAPVPAEVVGRLETLAADVGARLTMVRAIESTALQASLDPLTGLFNRRAMDARIAELLASGRPFSVAIGDLDQFKVLNDTHGHGTGDRALRLFAHTLRASLRPEDIAGRHGGEEFVVLLPGSTEDEAAAALERVRAALRAALARSDVPSFTVSFGVAGTEPGATAESLLEAADRALYRAKREGRDRVVVAGEVEAVP